MIESEDALMTNRVILIIFLLGITLISLALIINPMNPRDGTRGWSCGLNDTFYNYMTKNHWTSNQRLEKKQSYIRFIVLSQRELLVECNSIWDFFYWIGLFLPSAVWPTDFTLLKVKMRVQTGSRKVLYLGRDKTGGWEWDRKGRDRCGVFNRAKS